MLKQCYIFSSTCCLLVTLAPAKVMADNLDVTTTETTQQNQIKKEVEHNIERIDVYGRYVGLEVPEISGRFHLDKTFIENMPRGSGDINDLILLLPGVQGSEDSLSVSKAGEISAKLLSISGGQPWQTGFYMDGMNFNSRQDPSNTGSSDTSINDVYGAPQTYTVNSDIVDSIAVFDNNIPARYGYFSGGVVDVEGLNAFSSYAPSISVGYRRTQSSWGSFHLIDGFSDTGSDAAVDNTLTLSEQIPVYDIESRTLIAKQTFNQHHGLLISANHVHSTIADVSLQQFVDTERVNTNLLVKYSMRDILIDRLDWSVIYAPYQNHNLLTNVKDSEFTLDGGGVSSVLALQQDFAWGRWQSELSANYSKNSRQAPSHYYIWYQAKGVEWGRYDPTNASQDINDSNDNGVSFSKSGGYGDLDKTQLSTSLSSDISLDSIVLFNVEHDLNIGAGWVRDALERNRPQDSFRYNAPILYSASDFTAPLNCSGYADDCIGISYAIPLEQLAMQLGGSIDFSNPEHVFAYSNNVLTTPQYFQARNVYGAELINVDINQFYLYAEDNVEWGRATFRVGLRYDYDDFFKQHNLAPRLSVGIDVFNDNNSLFVMGVNRYYDAGLLTYKIRELARPYYVQYRPIQNGFLQGWTLSSDDSDYRYRYQDVTTPYNDEVMFGWKQATQQWGTFSLNYIYRWQRNQLARAGESFVADDGYRYANQDNSGKGTSERLTLSWSAQFGAHSLWANFSHTQNYRNNNDYDSEVDDVPTDELVYYEGEVITKDQLTRINTNFSRPITAKLGWTNTWSNDFVSSLTATYSGSYSSAVTSGSSVSTDILQQNCSTCAAYNLVIPFYRKVNFADRVLVDAAFHYTLNTANYGELRLSIDVNNVFNRRTYLITPGASGIETGRQIWLGVKYSYH